jgi:pSer/pThr/pTyr-binding forkhead associated (FHA) protein
MSQDAVVEPADQSAPTAPPDEAPYEVEEVASSEAVEETALSAAQETVPADDASPVANQGQMAEGGRACSSCGSTVPDGFAFCGACGTPVSQAAPVEAAQVPQQETATAAARLVLILPDGTEGGHVDIPGTEVAVGRDAGGFFANDPFLSPAHAIFRATESSVVVRDAESLNGTFAKVAPNEPVEIRSGDIFRMGQELILFEEIDKGSDAPDGTVKMGSPVEGLWGRVALIVGSGRLGNAFTVSGESIVLGRERGDIIFPEDGYVSGIHLKLYTEKGRFFLNDLGSSNGTFLKLTEEFELMSGSFLLMGQQLFRIDL